MSSAKVEPFTDEAWQNDLEMHTSDQMIRKRITSETNPPRPSEMLRDDSGKETSSRWNNIRHTIREDILGSLSNENGHRPMDRLWYQVDPYKAEQMVRAPKNYNPANKYFGCVYFLGVILFAAFAFYEFLTRPVIESYSITPSNTVSSIPVRVTLHCSEQFACGACDASWGPDWTCEGGNATWTTVSQRFKDTRSGYCDVDPLYQPVPGPMRSDAPTTIDLTACYSTNFTDGILIHVPFTQEYATATTRLIVTVASPGSELFYEQELEPAQKKSVFLGQTIYTDVDGSESKEIYVSDLFYDGKNSNSEAELRIKVTQFSTTSEKKRPGTIFGVFASIGGFVTFLLPVTGLLRDIWMKTYHKCLLCDNDGDSGSVLEIFASCLSSVGIGGAEAGDK